MSADTRFSHNFPRLLTHTICVRIARPSQQLLSSCKIDKVSSVMGRDDNWPTSVPSVVRRNRTSDSNLMADSESGSPDSCSTFLVTIRLSRSVWEIFACDRQTDGRTDNADHFYSWPTHCGRPAINARATKRRMSFWCVLYFLPAEGIQNLELEFN